MPSQIDDSLNKGRGLGKRSNLLRSQYLAHTRDIQPQFLARHTKDQYLFIFFFLDPFLLHFSLNHHFPWKAWPEPYLTIETISSAILSNGSTLSITFISTAALGIPKTTQLFSFWAMVLPWTCLIAFIPIAPSLPIPVRIAATLPFP